MSNFSSGVMCVCVVVEGPLRPAVMSLDPGKVLTVGCPPSFLPHCRAQDDGRGVCGGHGLRPVPRGLCHRGLAHQQVTAAFPLV